MLLLGETGSGKEVIAELLHRWSDRAHRPFVPINCSALPENLLEAELFGFEKGAFTGAVEAKPGQLELADGGTVFLDEVGDMPMALQAKLLRVLQDKKVARLGGRKPVEVDVRVVAATNRDLAAMIDVGQFRKDLYFRLKVVQLNVPPLRERREDIPPLVELFVRQFNEESSDAGTRRSVTGVAPAALDLLYRYAWPGNVRELRNVLHRAMLMSDGDLVLPGSLRLEGLTPSEFSSDAGFSSSAGSSGGSSGGLSERQRKLLVHLEKGNVIRSREYFEMAGVSPRTGLRDLNDLMSKGLIVRLGRRRAAAYKLADRPAGI